MRRCVLLFVAVTAFAALILAGGCQFTTAHFSEVTLARSIDASKAPVERTAGFTKSDPVLYCSARMQNTPADTKVKAIWWHFPDGAPKQVVDSTEIVLSEDAWVAFSLRLSQDALPYGKYAIDLSIDGKAQKQLPFTIAPMFETGPIKELTLSSEVAKDQFPLERLSSFKSGTPVMYAAVYVLDIPEGTTLSARWHTAGEGAAVQDIATASIPFAGSGWVAFSLKPKNPFPAGTYAVDISQNSTFFKTKVFSIE
jgi:hypothetical protein